MRQRAALIIRDQQRILLLYRYKMGHEYYVIPGGGIKKNESPEEAAIREIKEETSLDVANIHPFWQFNNRGNDEFYFYTEHFSGEPKLGGPELKKMSAENVYRICWYQIELLEQIPLFPSEIKGVIQAQL